MKTPKKLHRFLVQHVPTGETFVLEDPRFIHQALQVLKMSVGEDLIVFEDGSVDTVCTIIDRAKTSIRLQRVRTIAALAPVRRVVAAIAIAKGQTFEHIVQKLTELGVTTIVPLLTTRTVKQSVRIDRLQTISDEALEQSGSNIRVRIHEPMTLSQSLQDFQFPSIAFQANAPDSKIPIAETVCMYIGPEGGWSDEDIVLLNTRGVVWKSLGNHILRTETAAIVGAHEVLK